MPLIPKLYEDANYALYTKKEYQSAVKKFEEFIPAMTANDGEMGDQVKDSIKRVAQIYDNILNQPQKAIPYYQQQLSFSSLEDSYGILMTIANAYDKLNQSKSAIDYYQRSVAVRSKQLKGSRGDVQLATILNRLGKVQEKSGQYQQALSSYQQAASELKFGSGRPKQIPTGILIYSVSEGFPKGYTFEQLNVIVQQSIERVSLKSQK